MDAIWRELFEQQKGSKYIRVCNSIHRAVMKGILKGGYQLPPQREMADLLGVTLGTVTRGYREAEKRGLVAGEIGRGTFVRDVEKERYTLHERHNAPGREIASIPFDLNFPMEEGQPDLGEILLELTTQPDLRDLLCYQPAAGLPRHREAGRLWLHSFGVKARLEQVFITAGAQHGIQTVLQMHYRVKGALGVEHFTYPGVINTANVLGRSLVGIPMDSEGMVPEALDAACRRQSMAGIYLMPSIQNPTTVMMGEKRRLDIIDVARRHDLFILEDEVYAPLQQQHLKPIRESAPERTFYISGLSKVLAPGLRIGYLVIPEDKQKFAAAAMSSSIWMAPPLMAELACRWIHDGTVSVMVYRKREAAVRRLEILWKILGRGHLHARPGGLHAWLELPEWWQSEQFVREAAAQGVATLPASGFCPERRPAVEALRICFGAPENDEAVTRGCTIISRLLDETPILDATVF